MAVEKVKKIAYRRRLAKLESGSLLKLIEKLVTDDKLYYKKVTAVATTFNQIMQGVVDEIANGRKVTVYGLGTFYPYELPPRKHYNLQTKEVFYKDTTDCDMRFFAGESAKKYIRENFKGLKYKKGN